MEDLNLLQVVAAVLAGIVAGAINTLAGSGSTVSLPMLVYLGIPAHEANATNRIGIALQNIAAVVTLGRRKAIPMSRTDLWYTITMAVGGIGGAFIAAEISETVTNYVITVVLVVVLVTIFLNPEKWLRNQTEETEAGTPPWTRLLLFLGIGAYGGFIQAGVGLFILAGLVLGAGYSMVHANGLKLVGILVFTLMALAVFLALGTKLWWGIGLILAAGQSIGAWLAARFMAENDQAKEWMRWLLILVIVYSIVRFSGLQDLILNFLTTP